MAGGLNRGTLVDMVGVATRGTMVAVARGGAVASWSLRHVVESLQGNNADIGISAASGKFCGKVSAEVRYSARTMLV